jgi:general stress protein YciG
VAKEDRGFASMDRAKQREIASKGGKAAHQKGTAHEWTSEEARDAGRKGGIASHRRRREAMGPQGETSGDTGTGSATPNDETRGSLREDSSSYSSGSMGSSGERMSDTDRSSEGPPRDDRWSEE